MKVILILLFLPLAAHSQNITTKEVIELFEKHRNDTAYIVKYAFKHGFKDTILIRTAKRELNSLEIIWYNDSTDEVYTEFLSIYFTEPDNTFSYRTAKRDLFVRWYNDLPKLGFTRTSHYNGKSFTKTIYKKGKIGVILYQETQKSEYDMYDMTIGYDFSEDYQN
jgi:hypothetical protein